MDQYTTYPNPSQRSEYQFIMTSPQHSSFSAPVRISRINRDRSTSNNIAPTHSSQHMLIPSPTTPPPEPTLHILSPAPAETQEPRIPRPANAFMLFRSDFLKRGIVPRTVERRQQNLSRLAAMQWNSLSKEDRQYWDDMAEKVGDEHKLLYPDYKFQPSARGSKKNKGAKSRAEAAANNLEHLDNVRIKYLNMTEAPPPSSRKTKKEAKRARSERRVDATPATSSPVPSGSGTSQQSPSTPAMLTTTPIIPSLATPIRGRGSRKTNSAPMSTSLPQTPLGGSTVRDLPVYHSTEEGPRRPSTSLGFIEQMRQVQINDTYRAGTTSPPHQLSDQERLLYPLTAALYSPSISAMSLPASSQPIYAVDSPCSSSSGWMPPTPIATPIEPSPLLHSDELNIAYHSYADHAMLNAPLGYQANNHLDTTMNMEGLMFDLGGAPVNVPAMSMTMYDQSAFDLAAGPSQVVAGVAGMDRLPMMDFGHGGAAGEQNGLGFGVSYDSAGWSLGYGNGCA